MEETREAKRPLRVHDEGTGELVADLRSAQGRLHVFSQDGEKLKLRTKGLLRIEYSLTDEQGKTVVALRPDWGKGMDHTTRVAGLFFGGAPSEQLLVASALLWRAAKILQEEATAGSGALAAVMASSS